MSDMVHKFDVIIIGAGINGAGIARDAALRGLKVLLLDKSDVASGTSSGSTRLIHGGLRYLEHGELGLVRESLRERETLLHIAPHLVRPLPILAPIYEESRRGKATLKTGMLAYDLLSFGKSLTRHRMLSASETVNRLPALQRKGLKGAALFYDAQVEFPERLVVENVIAASDAGASVVTYASVTRLLIDNDRTTGVEFVSSGDVVKAEAAFVVNASGPWIDHVLNGFGQSRERLIGGTKGSHIVVKQLAGMSSTAVYVEAQSDGRPFFIIPWNGQVLIGTTDIRFDGDPDELSIAASEIDYLLNETNHVLPDAKLTSEHILYTYSGVRPLPYTDDLTEQKITRRHFIREHPLLTNLVSIVGGKLTTYRSLAEECVNLIEKYLGRAVSRCTTADVSLPGAGEVTPLKHDALQQRLFRIYGVRAREILELARTNERLAERLNGRGDAIAAEIVFSFRNEFATTLSDCLLRRTMLGLDEDRAIGVDELAVNIAKEFLDWSDEHANEEVKKYKRELERFGQ